MSFSPFLFEAMIYFLSCKSSSDGPSRQTVVVSRTPRKLNPPAPIVVAATVLLNSSFDWPQLVSLECMCTEPANSPGICAMQLAARQQHASPSPPSSSSQSTQWVGVATGS